MNLTEIEQRGHSLSQAARELRHIELALEPNGDLLLLVDDQHACPEAIDAFITATISARDAIYAAALDAIETERDSLAALAIRDLQDALRQCDERLARRKSSVTGV